MSKWLDRFLLSSLGRKFVMAVTGFLLVGFLIAHLAGNLNLYRGENGEKFVAYAEGLHSLGALVYVAEVLLVGLFATHIYVAFRLTLKNAAARPVPYGVKRTFGESTVASRNMFVTGSIVLAFTVVHLINFRFAKGLAAPPAKELRDLVVAVLTQPVYAALYLIGAIAVGVHVSHGFKSAFQSLGANHPQLNRCVMRFGLVLAVLLAVGFATFPLVALMCWKGGGA